VVVVALTAAPAALALTSATVTVNGVVKNFPLAMGLASTAAVKLGVFLPGSITGAITVSVVARAQDSCTGGYLGTATSSVPNAGATVNVNLTLAPGDVCGAGGKPGSGGSAAGTGGTGTGGVAGTGGAVGTGGGVAGTGGTAGTGGGGGVAGTGGAVGTGGGGGVAGTGGGGGSGASGGRGGASAGSGGTGAPPSLSHCVRYDHSDPPFCAAGATSFLRIRSVAFSPNGKLFASADENGRIKIWNFDGRTLTPEGHVLTITAMQLKLAFTPDGTQLIGGARGTIQSWNTTTWARTQIANVSGDVYVLRVTSDSRYVVSTVDATTVQLYRHDLQGISPAVQVEVPSAGLFGLALMPTSATGKHVAVVAMSAGKVAVVDLDAASLSVATTYQLGSSDSVHNLAITDDGKTLAAVRGQGVSFWTLPLAAGQNSTAMFMIAQGAGLASIGEIAFAPGGRNLAMGVDDSDIANIYTGIWDLGVAPRLTGRLDAGYTPSALAFSPNGTALAVGHLECGAIMLCVD